jgi:hypothetical protein
MYYVAGHETCIVFEIQLHKHWVYKVKHVGNHLYGVRKCISFPSFYHTKYFHYMVSRKVNVSRQFTIYLYMNWLLYDSHQV